MRTKNFIVILCSIVVVSFIIVTFGQNKPDTIQNIVSTTHQQIRNFQDNLRDAEAKTLVADEKYLTLLGLTKKPRLYPNDVWKNTSLPVIVTSVKEGQESQVYGLITNVAKVLPNNTLLVYDLGLSNYNLKILYNYCNNSRCQVQSFDFSKFPSHVTREDIHAYRPLIIQDALHLTGSILYMECDYRFAKSVTNEKILVLYEKIKNHGILAWSMNSKNPVSRLTHKKMFEYFHTNADNFLFVPMVSADTLFIINTKKIHSHIMLPWVQCALTQDCIIPIGAQSGGCRFDIKPIYRYSGCHNYDVSSLNIVLSLTFNFDSTIYTYDENDTIFNVIPLEKAIDIMKENEQNTTTETRFSDI